MKVAVIGAGISGLACAWRLQHDHDVHVFEASPRAGGHTHTVDVSLHGRRWPVDTGFIVYNRQDYPVFTSLLDDLGIGAQPTTMSFSVHAEQDGFEYNATHSLNRVFGQRRNLLRPAFYRMLADIARFYRQAPRLLESPDPGGTLAEYLDENRYSRVFRERHLLPMAAALWSSPIEDVARFPARALVAFMDRHSMLNLTRRPRWLVVPGGSGRYVEAVLARLRARIHLDTPVRRISRETVPTVATDDGTARFDAVIMACHSDQALALLERPSPDERDVLAAIRYSANDVTLHTDTRLLPDRRRCRAAWNYRLTRQQRDRPLVTYDMNQLQSLEAPETFCVTLNGNDQIEPSRILERFEYAHPQFDHAALAAQRRLPGIQGRQGTWFCGAWTGFGFHEDGAASGVAIAESLHRAAARRAA